MSGRNRLTTYMSSLSAPWAAPAQTADNTEYWLGPQQISFVLRFAGLFLIYYFTARLGLRLDAVSGFAAVVWPPTGIALAAIFLYGNRYWPAVALAAFTVNFTTGAPLFVAAGIALGNTLEAVVGAQLLRRFDFDPALERVRDVITLVLLAAFASTLISATIGTLSLLVGGIVTRDTLFVTWTSWWVGDMMGALLVTPVLLVWRGRYKQPLPISRLAAAVSIALVLVVASTFVFRASFMAGSRPFAFTYLIFPFLLWLSLRYGQRGSTSAMLIISIVAVWITIIEFEVSAEGSLSDNLKLLQVFMGITAVTFMTMAAVVAERENNLKHQEHFLARAAILKRQRAKLLALSEAKDEFIGLASHQLRTPATGVKQYVGMLLDGYHGKLTKDQQKILQDAYDCNERQIQIINELLAIAQIDAGNMMLRRERFDVAALVAEVMKDFRETLSLRHQSFYFSADKRIFKTNGDKERLRMVIENIIDNASKYSYDGKTVEITLNQNRAGTTVAIKDGGIGIARKDLPKLFKKFSRIDNPMSIDVGGTGLGLYLAKKIVHMHGGTITVSSKPDLGSVFTINLPARTRPAKKALVSRTFS